MVDERVLDLFGMKASSFGSDFTWGLASAAYQIEGAWDRDGKGPSIWDTFSHRRRWPLRTIFTGENGDKACDFYDRYESDIALMAALGFGANRFSVSWPRVLPEGLGRVNQIGLDFYSRVVDTTLSCGMEPWITLYHWDLPQALQNRGGWRNRDVVGWFEDYVDVVTSRLGDRVKNWMVFNEPLSFCSGGQLLGYSAPGHHNPRTFMAAVHHVNLCQAVGARVIRDRVADAKVGTTHLIAPVKAQGSSTRQQRAANSVDALIHGIFLEPNLGLGYPTEKNPLIRLVEPFIRTGDEKSIAVDFDFIGVQYYSAMKPIPVPILGGVPKPRRGRQGDDRDQLGWWIQPSGLYDSLAKLHSYDRYPRIVITENGVAYPDTVEGDRVYDLRRIDYLRRHIGEVTRAREAGIPVDGYFYWTFMDNFEWAYGYRPRFGLVHVDHSSQQRVVKDSGYWFRDFLSA